MVALRGEMVKDPCDPHNSVMARLDTINPHQGAVREIQDFPIHWWTLNNDFYVCGRLNSIFEGHKTKRSLQTSSRKLGYFAQVMQHMQMERRHTKHYQVEGYLGSGYEDVNLQLIERMIQCVCRWPYFEESRLLWFIPYHTRADIAAAGQITGNQLYVLAHYGCVLLLLQRKFKT